MNKYLKCLLVGYLLTTTHMTSAASKQKTDKIKAKCYVELYGGQNIIVYQMVKENNILKLPKILANRSVMTTLSNKKQKVFKVVECQEENSPFGNTQAVAKEKITPR